MQPSQSHPCPGNTGLPRPQAQTPAPPEPPPGSEQPRELLPTPARIWVAATPQCGGSWRRVPAGEEGSSQAAPSGPSKVSCLPQESSAPPALVSLCHCPALEVICCFINYLHTMGPLSAPEQHTLAFRSNALTSAHPGQTKCLCAAFPLGPAPTPTSPPRPAPTTAQPPRPPGPGHGHRCAGQSHQSVCRSLPREAWPSPAPCPSRMDGAGRWSGALALIARWAAVGLGGTGWLL